jgi:hypothetical protein
MVAGGNWNIAETIKGFLPSLGNRNPPIKLLPAPFLTDLSQHLVYSPNLINFKD